MNTSVSFYLLSSIVLATSLSAQTVIVDANFRSGAYNSNGSFEFDGSGSQLLPPPPAIIDGFGFWTSGDTTSLPGISRSVEQTRTWGSTVDGSLAAAIGRVGQQLNGAILNTGYDVPLSGDGQFRLSFDWTGNATAGGWEADDDLEVALFTSSNDRLSGTLTQLWAGRYFDGNGNNAFESIREDGIGSVSAASVGKDLYIVFSAGLAGQTNNDELAVVDNVKIVWIPEPEHYSLLLGAAGLTIIVQCRASNRPHNFSV